ncbi:tetratricopeptide repeat protein [Amycolatopsis sp. NPDC048633]|uniref:tetratricopeptide repeat protein n=1 Tax=Amycolatopsis sp. NPDC048633 TaxID=3157095 RepID=UPI003402171D
MPRQLPLVTEGFSGRATQLGELDRLLTGDRPEAVVISAIDGAAGIGKTTLAVRWSHRAADRFPDGQLYVNLRGFEPTAAPMAATEALRGFLAALRVPMEAVPADEEAQSALFRSILAGRRMLVLLDNARDAAQVRPLLPGSPTCAVIVTSRNRLAGLVARDGAHLVNLDVLTSTEARSLLVRRLGADRVDAEPEAAESLLRSCAGFPLALAITAARAAADPGLPLRLLADELRVEDDRLAALDAGDPHTNLESVFSWSYRSLTPGAAALFRQFGTQPGPDIGFEAACVLSGTSAPTTRKLLEELTRANLADHYVPARYRLHDLLRLYAKRQANSADFTAAARVLTWYRDRVAQATSWFDSSLAVDRHFRRCSDAIRWLDLERGNLVAAVLDGDEPELACLLSPFFRQRRDFDDWERTLTAALGTTAEVSRIKVRVQLHLARALSGARDEPDPDELETLVTRLAPADHAAALRHLADAHLVSGRVKLARETAEAALSMQRRLGDARSEACAWVFLADVQGYQFLFVETAASLKQALEIWRRLGDTWFEADSLVRRAGADRNRSHVATAIDCVDQAQAIYGTLDDPISVARTISLRGSILGQFGAGTPAHEAQRAAHRILLDEGATAYEELPVLYELVEAARTAGDYAACEGYLARRVAVAKAAGDPALTISALIARGAFHTHTGNHRQAIAVLREQRERARGQRPEVEGRAVQALGLAYAEQGRVRQAAACLEEYAELADSNQLRTEAISSLVDVYRDCGRYAEATTHAHHLLRIYSEQGDSGSTSYTLDTLGNLRAGLGRNREAIDVFERALAVRSEMGTDSYRRGWSLTDIADVHQWAGRFDDAQVCLERALDLRRQEGNRYGATQLTFLIACLHVHRRDFAKARPLVEEFLAGPSDVTSAVREGVVWLVRSYTDQYRFDEAARCRDSASAALEKAGARGRLLHLRHLAAEAMVNQGRGAEALDLLRAELDLATAIGDFANAGDLRGRLVSVLSGLRRFTEAAVDARLGLATASSVDSDADRVRFLILLGEIDHERGRYDQARWTYSAAAALCARNGDSRRSRILAALTRTHLRAGGFQQARAASRARLELERAAEDQGAVALALAELARVHAAMGDRTTAIELLRESFTRTEELEDPWYAASNFGECADVARELGDSERAECAFAAQGDLNRRLFDLAGYAESLAKLAEHRRGTGDLAGAAEVHEQSLRTREELGDPPGIADQLRRLGAVTAERGRHADAVALLLDSADRARAMGDAARLADAERALAEAHRLDGATAEATRCLERARVRYRQLGDDENERSCSFE